MPQIFGQGFQRAATDKAGEARTSIKVTKMPEAVLKERGPEIQTISRETDTELAGAVADSAVKNNEEPVQTPHTEKIEPEQEVPRIGEPPAQPLEDVSTLEPVKPIPDVRSSLPVRNIWVKPIGKKEQVRVRLADEPTTRPIRFEPEKLKRKKHPAKGTLLIRLKKDFEAMPVQPDRTMRRSRRIVFSDD